MICYQCGHAAFTNTPQKPDENIKALVEFWEGIGKDLVKQSLDSVEGTAKQIIGVTGILEGKRS